MTGPPDFRLEHPELRRGAWLHFEAHAGTGPDRQDRHDC
jgi:hypothetical protein